MVKKMIFVLFFFCRQQSFGQTGADTLQIKQAALNYIEGFYNSDGQRMAKAIHPELVKRTIVVADNGDAMLKTIGASELIFSTKKHKNAADESAVPFTATVTILDISNNIATIKIATNKFQFFDYAHLGKTGGEWTIINVLWAKKEN